MSTPQILKQLKKHYPDAHCALNSNSPFELLVATILSAQCTDERVNKVTPALFRTWPTPDSMAAAELAHLEAALSSVNFFRNKAKNLKAAAGQLAAEHDSLVPQDIEALIRLPGVGRKTANVVLGNAFGITSGIVVDTHVARVSFRLGWTKRIQPVEIEKDLMKIIPEKNWIIISHELIFHGRQICKARNPMCEFCFLEKLCPKKGVHKRKKSS